MSFSLASEIITQVESEPGIQAGITRLEEVLRGRSYHTDGGGSETTTRLDGADTVRWPESARTVLVLGLQHPTEEPQLDWWERGDTGGNRRLRKISDSLKKWLLKNHHLTSQPLPYHEEKGGLFLKDAAVLSGIGIVGRNNLLLHPDWGPRIRLRSILLEGDLQPSERLDGFNPCDTCEGYCQTACPVNAFPDGQYSRPLCRTQMDADVEQAETGKPHPVVKFCRACELACPVGR